MTDQPSTQEGTMEIGREMTRDELITELKRQALRADNAEARLLNVRERLADGQAIIDAGFSNPVTQADNDDPMPGELPLARSLSAHPGSVRGGRTLRCDDVAERG